MFNINSFSTEFKNVLVLAESYSKNRGNSIVGITDILYSILKYKSGSDPCEGYKIISLWAEETKSDLRLFENFLESVINTRNNSIQENKPNVGNALNITQDVFDVLFIAEFEAKKFGITVFGSDFFILALAVKFPMLFADETSSFKFDADLIREIISNKLVGGGNINPDGLDAAKIDKNENGPTPVLDAFSIDLTQKARENKIDPVVGRTIETDRIKQILYRKTKNNPVLIGEPGVGKTAIVEGFAQQLVKTKDNNLRLLQLSLTNLLAGTRYRGDFEERMKRIVEELVNNKNIIVFIDEIHTLLGAGDSEGAMNAANILKPHLARGSFKLIGATTVSEYRKYIEKDAAFERRLQPIMVEEPSFSETLLILKGCKESYENFHHLKIDDKALESCAKWSTKYVSGKYLPDKAFDVLDEACSKLVLKHKNVGMEDLEDLKQKKEIIVKEKAEFIKAKNFSEVKIADDKETEITKKIEDLISKINEKKTETPIVTPIDVASVISQMTGIDAHQLNEDDVERLFKMEDVIKEKIKGQDEAISAVCKSIIRWRSGVNDPKKPICNIMSLGPTGTGKTELAKAVAEYLFGSEERLIKIDMSEYSESIDVSKILGSTYGFVGYGEESALVKKIRSHPHSVILFDEITRGHKDIYPLFLQLMDEGMLTTGDGKKLDFRNAIIFFTSNLGADKIYNINKRFGFGSIDLENKEKQTNNDIKSVVLKEVENEFPPEFINRVDKIVVFNRLNKNLLLDIVDLKINKLGKRIEKEIKITELAKNKIIDYNYDDRYGARPILRSISENLEDRISELILRRIINDETKILKIDYDTDKFTFDVE